MLKLFIQIFYKVVEHINLPTIIDRAVAFFHPFIKADLMSMLKYRKNIEESYENVPQEMYPCDYPGGKGPSLESLYGEQNFKKSKYFF